MEYIVPYENNNSIEEIINLPDGIQITPCDKYKYEFISINLIKLFINKYSNKK